MNVGVGWGACVHARTHADTEMQAQGSAQAVLLPLMSACSACSLNHRPHLFTTSYYLPSVLCFTTVCISGQEPGMSNKSDTCSETHS